jgi:hypothetical protein
VIRRVNKVEPWTVEHESGGRLSNVTLIPQSRHRVVERPCDIGHPSRGETSVGTKGFQLVRGETGAQRGPCLVGDRVFSQVSQSLNDQGAGGVPDAEIPTDDVTKADLQVASMEGLRGAIGEVDRSGRHLGGKPEHIGGGRAGWKNPGAAAPGGGGGHLIGLGRHHHVEGWIDAREVEKPASNASYGALSNHARERLIDGGARSQVQEVGRGADPARGDLAQLAEDGLR